MDNYLIAILKSGPIHYKLLYTYILYKLTPLYNVNECLTRLYQQGIIKEKNGYWWHRDIDPSNLFR